MIIRDSLVDQRQRITCNPGDMNWIPRLGRAPGTGNGNPLLHGKSHGQRSQAGYSPWGHKELDMTEHTHMEKLEPLFIVVGKVNDVVSVGKSLAVPQKVKYINLKNFNLSYDLAI